MTQPLQMAPPSPAERADGDAVTAAQMRAIEQAAMASGAATGRVLMERAGAGVVEATLAAWPELASGGHRAVVLCGPGNNGGDGFVIARLLRDRGWQVEAVLYGDPARLPPDARANFESWIGMGGTAAPVDTAAPRQAVEGRAADVWFDALFGTGLTRPLPADLAALLGAVAEARAERGGRLVAVDILSGLDSDTGAALSPLPMAADLTVTFHRRKRGHLRGRGPDLSGRVVVAGIGL